MISQEVLYEMIFKRKSFHLFRERLELTEDELREIEAVWKQLVPLVADIRTDIRIVPAEETTCKRGQEYCILMYSEQKEHYLQNIGYLGEQLDLYLASKNIGALWFGIGKVEEPTYGELEFVIMIGIAKMPREKFRKDMFKSKRKPLDEVWQGACYQEIGNIARFAPSACNTQPWIVEATEKKLLVYRYKKPGKRGIMPVNMVAHYNRMDIGIYLLFLELCLKHQEISFEREVFPDEGDDLAEKVLVAQYSLE